jgi:hypothetical protein
MVKISLMPLPMLTNGFFFGSDRVTVAVRLIIPGVIDKGYAGLRPEKVIAGVIAESHTGFGPENMITVVAVEGCTGLGPEKMVVVGVVERYTAGDQESWLQRL